ncbi:MAG: hypothetical protein K0R50_4265 [Eubacterium sp.]|jgi:hypothetical protein|nr:hypothetical protein [Eubacterium sp.]
MEYLLIFLSNFILNPFTVQLEVFKTALLCFMTMGALALCCRIISGHLSIDLDILGRRNLKLITIYKHIKIPDILYFINQ